jgi:ABC-type transport system involved in cytochrome bd biosynthesis fused ATPase/permease subunit
MKIFTADDRLAEKSGPKIVVTGVSGIGKTSLLRTLSEAQLASTLFVEIEAGGLAVSDLKLASIRPRTWHHAMDRFRRPQAGARIRLHES